MARSDHDMVWAPLPSDQHPPPPRSKPTWGARRFSHLTSPTAEARIPPTQTDTHTAISQLALRITEHGRPTQRFRESNELKEARRQAHRTTGDQARALWKQVSKARKREHRAWFGGLVTAASKTDWGAYRAVGQLRARVGWQHKLTDDPRWQEHLATHFKGIFAKAPTQRTLRRLGDTRRALTRLCKSTPWKPFTVDDLQLATRTWKKHKATGPDGITHEVLRLLLQEEVWVGRLLRMVNDFLYGGGSPPPSCRAPRSFYPRRLATHPPGGTHDPSPSARRCSSGLPNFCCCAGGTSSRMGLQPSGRRGGNRHQSCSLCCGGSLPG